MTQTQKTRVMVFIDGFNIYHALDRLQTPHLKWLNLVSLTNSYFNLKSHEVVKTYYFSAIAQHRPRSKRKHELYIDALRSCGAIPVLGRFKKHTKECFSCKKKWDGYEEKATDVNIAIHLLNEAYQDNFDIAFILSSDNDFVPVIKMIKNQFPKKRIMTLIPIKNKGFKEIISALGDVKNLRFMSRSLLEKHQLSDEIHFEGKIINRPDDYKRPLN